MCEARSAVGEVSDDYRVWCWALGRQSVGAAVTSADLGLGDPSGFAQAVDAASGGDEHAFRTLFCAVQPGLLRYLYGLVGDDAEDVASETWLQIARDLRSYRGEGAGFRGWAVSIARHRALDHLRQQRRRHAVATPVEEFAHLAGADSTSAQAIEAVATRAVIAWIAALPRGQAEAILLRVVVGLDTEAAALVLGKRAGAVRTAAYRGLRRLAEHLDRDPMAGLPPPDPRRRRQLAWLGDVTKTRSPAPRDVR
jgi:RNA polymerase sigma-70 factor (ECF subfamily)